MGRGLLITVTALLGGTGSALAQAPPPPEPVPVTSSPNTGMPPPGTLPPPLPGPIYYAPHGPPAPVLQEGPPADTSLWFSAEYLLWWFKKSPMPVPLVTSSPATAGSTGALNDPTATVVLGGQDLD